MHSNQREDNQRGAEVCMHLLHISCLVFHVFFSRPKKIFHGTDCCSLAVTVGAGMNLHPIMLRAPLTTHHTLEACLRSLRNSLPDLNLQAAKELQTELAKYIATCTTAAAASVRTPRKRRQDKPGLFSLTKYDLALVMGFLERVRCQAVLPSCRATTCRRSVPPPSSPRSLRLTICLFRFLSKWPVDLLAWVHRARIVKPRWPISKKDLLSLTELRMKACSLTGDHKTVCLSAFPLLTFIWTLLFVPHALFFRQPPHQKCALFSPWHLNETCLSYALYCHAQVLSQSNWAYWWVCWTWVYPKTSLPVFHLLFSLDMGSKWRRRLAFNMPFPSSTIAWIVFCMFWLGVVYPRSHPGWIGPIGEFAAAEFRQKPAYRYFIPLSPDLPSILRHRLAFLSQIVPVG